MKREWKNHKGSNIIFIIGTITCLFFIIMGIKAYKQNYVLPETVQTLLLFVLFGYILFRIFLRMAEQTREKEND